MKNNSIKLFLLCAVIIIPVFFLTRCLKEGELHRPFTSFAPADINDGWQLSNPGAENIDSLALIQIYKDLYNHEKAWSLRSMLVIRNNKLIAESYLKSDDEMHRYNAIWSCTKQVTGIMTGIAIGEGYIDNVNDPIEKYLPKEMANHPDKKGITIEDLLTMRSGIYFDNDVESDVYRTHETTNSVDYVLGNDLSWEPGSTFQYNDGSPQIVSAIIQKTTGMTMASYAELKLFSEIGLTKYEWKDYSDGITIGAFGLMMPPRELAKICQCVCDSGKWNDRQVIPKNWIEQMLTLRVPNLHDDIGFGYYWWISTQRGLVYMWGHGGQYAIAYPKKRLVIVVTALEQVDDDIAFWYQDVLYFADRIFAISN
jgi:CubicO group peptidase (beta-lactamase class C family)